MVKSSQKEELILNSCWLCLRERKPARNYIQDFFSDSRSKVLNYFFFIDPPAGSLLWKKNPWNRKLIWSGLLSICPYGGTIVLVSQCSREVLAILYTGQATLHTHTPTSSVDRMGAATSRIINTTFHDIIIMWECLGHDRESIDSIMNS